MYLNAGHRVISPLDLTDFHITDISTALSNLVDSSLSLSEYLSGSLAEAYAVPDFGDLDEVAVLYLSGGNESLWGAGSSIREAEEDIELAALESDEDEQREEEEDDEEDGESEESGESEEDEDEGEGAPLNLIEAPRREAALTPGGPERGPALAFEQHSMMHTRIR